MKNSEVKFQDPKRVHTALREFNDVTANKVFSNIISQVQQLENDEKAKLGGGFQRRGTLQPGKAGGGLAGEAATQSSASGATSGMAESFDVMASVEKMLASEKTTLKSMPKAAANFEFDLNEGVVTVSSGKGTKGVAGGSAMSGSAGAFGSSETSMTTSSSSAAGGAIGMSAEDESGDNFLDQDIAVIQRRGTLIKSNNVGAVFMQNIGAISETVQEFQKMSEDTFKNDAALYFQ